MLVVGENPRYLGKRLAYTVLYQQQIRAYGACHFNYNAFVSAFDTSKDIVTSTTRKRRIQDNGNAPHFKVDAYGFIDNAESFVLNKVKHTFICQYYLLIITNFLGNLS